MTTTEQLADLLAEPRNGASQWVKHSLIRRFYYTDGVKEMAEMCGAYWLLDLIATEACDALKKQFQTTYQGVGLVEVDVAGTACTISLTLADDTPPEWQRAIEYTDFPNGHWVFKLAMDSVLIAGQTVCVMCLLTED